MADEGVGEVLTRESGAAGEGLEGLPGLVGVAGEEGFVDAGLQRGDVV